MLRVIKCVTNVKISHFQMKFYFIAIDCYFLHPMKQQISRSNSPIRNRWPENYQPQSSGKTSFIAVLAARKLAARLINISRPWKYFGRKREERGYMNVNIISLRAINLSHFCQLIPLIVWYPSVLFEDLPPMHLYSHLLTITCILIYVYRLKKNDGFLS